MGHTKLVGDRPQKPAVIRDIALHAFLRYAHCRRNQHARELPAGELATLIRIEYLRVAVPSQGLLQSIDAERGVHRIR